MTTASNHNQKLMKMIAVGLMAALVFVGNYLQIKIPVAIGDVLLKDIAGTGVDLVATAARAAADEA